MSREIFWDDYEHVVAGGQSNIVGNFIEKSRSNSNVITSNKTLKLLTFKSWEYCVPISQKEN